MNTIQTLIANAALLTGTYVGSSLLSFQAFHNGYAKGRKDIFAACLGANFLLQLAVGVPAGARLTSHFLDTITTYSAPPSTPICPSRSESSLPTKSKVR